MDDGLAICPYCEGRIKHTLIAEGRRKLDEAYREVLRLYQEGHPGLSPDCPFVQMMANLDFMIQANYEGQDFETAARSMLDKGEEVLQQLTREDDSIG